MKIKRVALLLLVAMLCTSCSGKEAVSDVHESQNQDAEIETVPSEPGSPESTMEVETEHQEESTEVVAESQEESSEPATEPESETEPETEPVTEPEEVTETKETDTAEETQIPEETEEVKETASDEPAEQEPEKEPESEIQETAHTHAYSVISETPGTCMAEGTRVYKCACGNSRTENTAKTGHNYVTENKAATCKDNGYTKTYCSVCGAVDSETVVNATGQHSYSSTVTTAANCGTDGVMTYTCSGCGNSYTESIPATASHAFFETSREDALCHQDGWITYHCAYCEIPKTEVIPALGGEHTWVEKWFLYPTCAYEGEGHHLKCSRCGYYEELPELTEGLGCVADEGTVRRVGTCIYPAELEHYCIRCGGYMGESYGNIDPNNHDWRWDEETQVWYCGWCQIEKE